MDDSKIIGFLYERNEKGLSEIQNKYGREMLGLATRITGSSDDAQEVLNDTLSAIWTSIPPAFPDPLSSYVLKICRNIACKRVRYRNTQKRHADTVSFESIFDELSDTLVTGDDESENETDITGLINEFLSKEKQKNRIIFVRRYWYSDSIESISRITGISKPLITVRLSRMKAKLLKALTEKGVKL